MYIFNVNKINTINYSVLSFEFTTQDMKIDDMEIV